MTTLVVTGHDGAVEWLARRGYGGAKRVEHFDPSLVTAGDVVVGTLPVHLVADLTARGVRYLHLVLDLTAGARTERRNLTADEMDGFNARIQEFRAFPV